VRCLFLCCYNHKQMATNLTEALSFPGSRAVEQTRAVRRNGYIFLLILITLLAAFLRIHAITSKSFWMDEGMSVEYARLPWHIFLRAAWNREANMALYYILLRYWLLLGHSDGFVRGLSALFSVATVPLLYDLGRRLFDRQIAIVAAFLLATHAYHIRYAQEARSYAMVVFLCVLASWLFVRNLQEPFTSRWRAYTAICVLAVYAHFYTGLVVVAHLVALAALPHRDVPWKAIAKHLLWFTCLVTPIAVFVVRTGTEPIGWIQPVNAEILRRFGFSLSGNYGRPLLILVVVSIAIGFIAAGRKWQSNRESDGAWSYVFVVAWLFVPIAVVIGVSFVHPLFVARYLNPCLPALVLLVAAANLAIRPRALGLLLLFAISVCSILGTFSYYRNDFDVSRQDWRAAANYVSRHVQPGDSIFFYQGGAQPPFDFYFRWQRTPAPPWPKSLNPSYATEESNDEYQLIPGTEIKAATPVGDRVWLVFLLPSGPNGLPDAVGPKIRDWFAAGRQRIDVQRLNPIDVVLFARNARASDQDTRNSW
jgi:mannosyltransferase